MIETTLSESTTTRVYRAYDDALHRRVLLKVLHRSLASDRAIRERFVREARACASLRSEHIVQVYGLTEVEGAPAIVMEYAEGRSLKDVLADPGSPGIDLARRVAVQVLRALTVAHANGIVHRDIKPGNLIVLPDGTIKVTDFGLAQVAAATTLTADGVLIGTPAYLSPEAVRGEPTDARSDLFSLGATVVEALSGERIFDGTSYGACLSRISAFRTEFLDRLLPSAPPEFLKVLRRLMDPDPAQRFTSAEEALSALTSLKPTQALPDAFRTPFPWRLAFLTAAVLAVLGGVFLAVSILDPRTTQSGPTPSDSVRGSLERGIDSVTRTRETKDQPGSVSPPVMGSDFRNLPAGSVESTSVPDSGTVRITSAPWARVFVDERLIGETPLAGPVLLPHGSHTVVFTHPSFEPIVKSVSVTGGREASVHGDFLEKAGYLRVTVTPWAEVFVDGIYRDTTPLQSPIILSAGSHRVRFHHAAYRDVERFVTVAAHDTVTISFSFAE